MQQGGQPPLDLTRELVPLLQVPDEPEANAADGRGVDLHQVEPVGVGLVLHHGEPDDGERDGQHDKADEPGPFPATRDFVEHEQSREHRKPDCPNRQGRHALRKCKHISLSRSAAFRCGETELKRSAAIFAPIAAQQAACFPTISA